jgi:hypothetical protein
VWDQGAAIVARWPSQHPITLGPGIRPGFFHARISTWNRETLAPLLTLIVPSDALASVTDLRAKKARI